MSLRINSEAPNSISEATQALINFHHKPLPSRRRARNAPSSAKVVGDLPQIIANEERLYEGDLVVYFRVLFFKADNLNNPYHNFRHMLHVLWLCYLACRYYHNEFSPREMRILLIAALFHDFDHRMENGCIEVLEDIADRLRALGERQPEIDLELRRYADNLDRVARELREVITAGGFTTVRRATETPFNMILEARP